MISRLFQELSKYTDKTDDYPYLTDAQRSAAKTALNKYAKIIIDGGSAAVLLILHLNVIIPEGIQAIKDGLFVAKEDADADKT